jgi:hypothetical protein
VVSCGDDKVSHKHALAAAAFSIKCLKNPVNFQSRGILKFRETKLAQRAGGKLRFPEFLMRGAISSFSLFHRAWF